MAEQVPEEEAQFQELVAEIRQSTARQVQEMSEIQNSFERRASLMRELELRLTKGIDGERPQRPWMPFS